MKKRTSLIVIALLAINLNSASAAGFGFTVGNFIIPAPTSTNNNGALQNAFSYAESGWSAGYIPLYSGSNDVRSLNIPVIWRASEIIYGPASFQFWDATNSTSGESGSRLLRIGDITNTTPFYAREIWFKNASTDFPNALGYEGNLATNTSTNMVLTFSPTLRGELRDTNGTLIRTYVPGESLTNPVTRIMSGIRVGWFVNNTNEIALDLSYFKGHMNQTPQLATTIMFYTKDGGGNVADSGTNNLSAHWMWGKPYWNGSNWAVPVAGQRQLGLTYHLWRTLGLEEDVVNWLEIATGPQGSITDPEITGGNVAMHQRAFYFVTESAPNPPVFNKSSVAPSAPQLVIENGPE